MALVASLEGGRAPDRTQGNMQFPRHRSRRHACSPGQAVPRPPGMRRERTSSSTGGCSASRSISPVSSGSACSSARPSAHVAWPCSAEAPTPAPCWAAAAAGSAAAGAALAEGAAEAMGTAASASVRGEATARCCCSCWANSCGSAVPTEVAEGSCSGAGAGCSSAAWLPAATEAAAMGAAAAAAAAAPPTAREAGAAGAAVAAAAAASAACCGCLALPLNMRPNRPLFFLLLEAGVAPAATAAAAGEAADAADCVLAAVPARAPAAAAAATAATGTALPPADTGRQGGGRSECKQQQEHRLISKHAEADRTAAGTTQQHPHTCSVGGCGVGRPGVLGNSELLDAPSLSSSSGGGGLCSTGLGGLLGSSGRLAGCLRCGARCCCRLPGLFCAALFCRLCCLLGGSGRLQRTGLRCISRGRCSRPACRLLSSGGSASCSRAGFCLGHRRLLGRHGCTHSLGGQACSSGG